MASKNDQEILKLKKEVATRQAKLKKGVRFDPKTNCVIKFDGVEINLHVAPRNTLLLCIAKLRLLSDSLKKEYPDETLIINSFPVDDWISDFKDKFAVVNENTERERLGKLETKLHSLLTEDTKTSLEIDDIKKSL